MKAKHWALLGGFLVTVGAQLGTIRGGWEDALTPQFAAVAVGQLGLFLIAMFSDKPRDAENATDRKTDR